MLVTKLEQRLARARSLLMNPACLVAQPPFVAWRPAPDAPVRCSELKKWLTIGRGEDCDIEIPQVDVSRRHARIELHGGRVLLFDLESLNGTVVNGSYTAFRELHSGDIIEVCDAELTLIKDVVP